MQWPGMEDFESEGLNGNVTYLNPRTRVLEWLGYLQDHASAIHAEDELLVWNTGGSLCSISSKSGFIERLEIPETSKFNRLVVTLEFLKLDEPVAELFELPPEAETAEEMEELKGTLSRSASLRKAAFQRIETRLASGELVWEDDVRADWEAVVDAIHREMVPEKYSDWQEETRGWIEGVGEQVRSALGEDSSPENLAILHRKAEEAREALVERLDGVEENYLEHLPATSCKHSTHEPRVVLFEVEEEVIRTVYDELIHDPILGYFDEQIEAAFDS